MKVAIVHDWLLVNGGAEKVLKNILEKYPEAELFTLVDFLPESSRDWLKGVKIHTSFIQRLPFARKSYRNYLPLFPIAIEQFNMSKFDLIISSSYSVAKGIISGPDQKHVCYCHSPARYAWDLQHQYLVEAGLTKGIKGIFVRYFLHKFRIWDTRTSNGVDKFIANSNFIKRRIYKCYRRNADVIHPPAELDRFQAVSNKEEYFITASRLVPYKKIDVVVKAFASMPDKKLLVVGDGPDMQKIKKLATPNIKVMGFAEDAELVNLIQHARAFVFAAEEDFGIMPVEAQACGTPVIGLAKGGMLETVINGVTGVLFPEQDERSIVNAIHEFETIEEDLSSEEIRKHANKFSTHAFKQNIERVVSEVMDV